MIAVMDLNIRSKCMSPETVLSKTVTVSSPPRYQRILNGHFDLKTLYTDELEKIAEMSLVQRFSLRTELFNRIVEQPACLERMDIFLHPLFNRDPERILNLNRVFEPQKTLEAEEEESGTMELDFDEEAWLAEQEEQKRLASMGWHCITVWECQLKPKVREATLQSLVFTLNHIFVEDHKLRRYVLPGEESDIAAEPDADANR